MDRVLSPLDVFEKRIDMTRDSLNQFVQLINRRLDVVKQEVQVLKTRFRRRASRAKPTQYEGIIVKSLMEAEPHSEIISIKECVKYCQNRNRDTFKEQTTGGPKRLRHSAVNKRAKTNTDGNGKNPPAKKFKCKGCDKSFKSDSDLACHERIHLGTKPFSCAWPQCRYSAQTRPNIIRHIRINHFKLPITKQVQEEQNIEDGRDPNDYIRVDEEQLNRRLGGQSLI